MEPEDVQPKISIELAQNHDMKSNKINNTAMEKVLNGQDQKQPSNSKNKGEDGDNADNLA
jgi:hypothetical protein